MINTKKTILCVILAVFFGCGDFKTHNETFIIYPEETDNLEVLDSAKIVTLIKDYAVGRYLAIEKDTIFVPVNFEYQVSKVGKYKVPIGDLVITEKVNNYKPIRFFSEDKDDRNDADRNTFLFFLPSTDSIAITKEKLSRQFHNIDFINNNSLIVGGTVIYYKYDIDRKGFEVFHSEKLPAFNEDITKNEILYESIDILRMAKNLHNKKPTEFNWDKLNYVTPLHFSRYFTQKIVDTLSIITKKQTANFQMVYKPDKLSLEISVIKDSCLTMLLNDLKKTPLKQDYKTEANYSSGSLRILDTYLGYRSSDIKINKREANTFYMEDFPGRAVLHFIPEKKLLFTIKDTDYFNDYNDEIYFRYFNKILIPKL